MHAEAEGTLMTHRFLFRGEDLRINARAEPGGTLAAELLNDGGQVIEAFGMRKADAFGGDNTDHVLSWGGRTDLTSLIGQNLMLRVELRKAELFSFRVGGRKERFSARLGPPPVRCGRCGAPPVISGILDDACWQDFSNSGVAADFVEFTENCPAEIGTRVLITRDDANLYIAADCDEPQAEKLQGMEAEGAVNYQKEEVLELRLSAPDQGTFFNQLMVTASGRQRHCWFSVEEGGSKVLDSIEWEAATTVGSGHWYVEMAVPFKSLRAEPPASGEKWQMNIIRHRHLGPSGVSCWSCMFGGMHRNDLSGTLVFV